MRTGLQTPFGGGNVVATVAIECDILGKNCEMELDAWKRSKRNLTERGDLVRAWLALVNCAVDYDPALLQRVYAEDQELIHTIDVNFRLNDSALADIANKNLSQWMEEKKNELVENGSYGQAFGVSFLRLFGIPIYEGGYDLLGRLKGQIGDSEKVEDTEGNAYYVATDGGKSYLLGRSALTGKYYLIGNPLTTIEGAVTFNLSGGLAFGPRNGLAAGGAWSAGTKRHHNIAKFLGGDQDQILSHISGPEHLAYHRALRAELNKVGLTRPTQGPNGSAAKWEQQLTENPGQQQAAFLASLRAARRVDAQYGTHLVSDITTNINGRNFTQWQ